MDRPIKQGGGINLADRIIYSICEAGYRTKKKNGKMVFDCKEAIRKDPLVWKFYKGNAEGLASRLRQVSESLEKHDEDYLKTTEGSRSLWRKRDLFGNVEMFNAVCDELRSLIESGENLDDHSKRLEGTYRPGGRNIRRRTLDDFWKWISQEYPEKFPAQEIEALRNQEYLKPLTRKERQFWKEFQAKNRDQEKIRRAAISA